MTQATRAIAAASAVRLERKAILDAIPSRRPFRTWEAPAARRARQATCMALIARTLKERFAALATMRIWDLLELACNESEIRKLLKHAGITSEYRQLGDLTDRQIEALAYALTAPTVVLSGDRR